MSIHVDDAARTAEQEELWLAWHGAAQAVDAALATVAPVAEPQGRMPRIPSPRRPARHVPAPETSKDETETALCLMVEHQQALGERVRAAEEAGTPLPGCRAALAEMVTTLGRLRRETCSRPPLSPNVDD